MRSGNPGVDETCAHRPSRLSGSNIEQQRRRAYRTWRNERRLPRSAQPQRRGRSCLGSLGSLRSLPASRARWARWLADGAAWTRSAATVELPHRVGGPDFTANTSVEPPSVSIISRTRKNSAGERTSAGSASGVHDRTVRLHASSRLWSAGQVDQADALGDRRAKPQCSCSLRPNSNAASRMNVR